MAKGENIFKRRDGRWEARYRKGSDASGRIRYGYCYGKTYREAKEKVTRMKAAVMEGNAELSARDKRRFAFFCDEWLRSRRSKCRESTLVKYETILERHIKPSFGSFIPSKISAAAIDAFTEELLAELSPKTVRDILTAMRSVLKFCSKQDGMIPPQVEISYPKDTKKEMRVLSREEQERFISYLTEELDACRFGILLALTTGIRIGELCALTWSAVSLRDRTVRISSTMQRLHDRENGGSKTKIVIGEPKSDTSMRTIPITDAMAELCRRMNPGNPNAYILTGTPDFMEPRALQYRFSRYTKECGLENVHFHTLRHTFATRCVEVGFEIKSLSEILGHANTTITLDRYVHSTMELKKENMKKLNAIGF